ncbi:hypothetical protein GKE82_23540 [Conexibacter sp. W3-3-2]|uniref:hypothetical protein n=1 Tax=Conexibacter sp. W3-3-2 TaxID=2675227 RepID=UPI0012B9506E|nr:hypothetical protein [Conexibacter sp. W3-3-2]MTD47179.1 hypothetical protein [Conexibacter sp. W3-3-2]
MNPLLQRQDALANAQGNRLAIAQELRRIQQLPSRASHQAAARALNPDAPHSGAPVLRLLRAVRGIGTLLAPKMLETAGIGDHLRIRDLTAAQIAALTGQLLVRAERVTDRRPRPATGSDPHIALRAANAARARRRAALATIRQLPEDQARAHVADRLEPGPTDELTSLTIGQLLTEIPGLRDRDAQLLLAHAGLHRARTVGRVRTVPATRLLLASALTDSPYTPTSATEARPGVPLARWGTAPHTHTLALRPSNGGWTLQHHHHDDTVRDLHHQQRPFTSRQITQILRTLRGN